MGNRGNETNVGNETNEENERNLQIEEIKEQVTFVQNNYTDLIKFTIVNNELLGKLYELATITESEMDSMRNVRTVTYSLTCDLVTL